MSYFDNNATTPLHPNAHEVFVKALSESWANPSSPYRLGAQLRASLEICREEISSIFGVSHDEVVFTSGATEANNSVFFALSRSSSSSDRVLLSPFEHPSVTDAAEYWFPKRVDFLRAQPDGTICISELEDYLRISTPPVLVSIMAASNESGVVQPWKEAAGICKSHGIHFHCDSTQLIGKKNVKGLSLCSSFISSAHKFGGPKGVGWLMGKCFSPFLIGGQQEKGMRGGTENFAAVSSSHAAFLAVENSCIDTSELAAIRDRFEHQMLKLFPDLKIIGCGARRLWNTSLMIMPDFENFRWVGKLDKLGFQVSTGSACSTSKFGGSPLATALNLSDIESRRLVRVSSYFSNSSADWAALLSAFDKTFMELQEESRDSAVISL